MDALICVGDFQYQLAYQITEGANTKLYKLYNGLTQQRHQQLSAVVPSVRSKKILFISNGPGNWRTWYKGLDLIIEAVCIARLKDPDISLQIIGDWDNSEREALLNSLSVKQREFFVFHGGADIVKHLKDTVRKNGSCIKATW